MFFNKKNKNTTKFENKFERFASTEFKSLENLFRILPKGTRSKN